jgi:hypothetical protein
MLRRKVRRGFERNSTFIFSSRFSRSSSRSRARSDTGSAGSSPACASRYSFTQLPSVVLLTFSSRATRATVWEVSTTILAASSLNSGENFLRFLVTRSRSFPEGSYWIPCPGTVEQLITALHRLRVLPVEDFFTRPARPAPHEASPWGNYVEDSTRSVMASHSVPGIRTGH